MAEVKPLRLKTQRVAKKVAVAQENPVAQVCVDTGVFHLPDCYDYLVPEEFSDLVVPGVFVKVPFGNSEVTYRAPTYPLHYGCSKPEIHQKS